MLPSNPAQAYELMTALNTCCKLGEDTEGQEDSEMDSYKNSDINKKNDRMRKLSLDQMKTVTGGAWNFDSLTPAELKEYNDLQDLWQKAEDEQQWDIQRTIEQQINAFIDRMDAKYGA